MFCPHGHPKYRRLTFAIQGSSINCRGPTLCFFILVIFRLCSPPTVSWSKIIIFALGENKAIDSFCSPTPLPLYLVVFISCPHFPILHTLLFCQISYCISLLTSTTSHAKTIAKPILDIETLISFISSLAKATTLNLRNKTLFPTQPEQTPRTRSERRCTSPTKPSP